MAGDPPNLNKPSQEFALTQALAVLHEENNNPPNSKKNTGQNGSTSPPDTGFMSLLCDLLRDEIAQQNPTLGARYRVLIS